MGPDYVRVDKLHADLIIQKFKDIILVMKYYKCNTCCSLQDVGYQRWRSNNWDEVVLIRFNTKKIPKRMKNIYYYIEFIKGRVIKFWLNIMMNTSLQNKD